MKIETCEEIYTSVKYLVKKIQECEEERKSILQGIKTFQSTLYYSGNCGNLINVCENLKSALENVSVKVQNDAENEKMDGQAKESKRKCRYFNRGYCKYGMNCKFFHSKVICNEYVEEGGCQTTGCSKRHPRQCRYWTENPEGCRRSDTCQYLHVKIESLSNNESDNTDIMGEVGDDEESVSPCDKRDSYHDNRNVPRCHRRSMDPETEESYVVMRGNDGKARFVCKKCEATFTSQKSIKQHDMMKHVDPRFY